MVYHARTSLSVLQLPAQISHIFQKNQDEQQKCDGEINCLADISFPGVWQMEPLIGLYICLKF